MKKLLSIILKVIAWPFAVLFGLASVLLIIAIAVAAVIGVIAAVVFVGGLAVVLGLIFLVLALLAGFFMVVATNEIGRAKPKQEWNAKVYKNYTPEMED
jgi:hypothetical protein